MPELGIMPFSTLTRQQRGVFPLPHPRSKEGRLRCPYIFKWWGEPHQNFLLYTVHKIILNLHVKTLLVTAGADATVQILFIYILTRNRPFEYVHCTVCCCICSCRDTQARFYAAIHWRVTAEKITLSPALNQFGVGVGCLPIKRLRIVQEGKNMLTCKMCIKTGQNPKTVKLL